MGRSRLYLAEIFSRILASVYWSVSCWDEIFFMMIKYCDKLEGIEVIVSLRVIVKHSRNFASTRWYVRNWVVRNM